MKSKIPVYVDRGRAANKFRSHYFPLMFKMMGAGDSLVELPAGEARGMLHILGLGSPYRVSKELAGVKGDGFYVFDAVDRAEWRKIEAGGGVLMLEMLIESFFGRPDLVSGLHEGISESGISPDRVSLVNCNLASQREYESIRLKLGLPRGPQVLPFNGCYWILKGHNRAIPERAEGVKARAQRAHDLSRSMEKRPKKFVSFNGSQRAHRVYIVMRLWAEGYLEQGLVSLLGHSKTQLPAANIERLIAPYEKSAELSGQLDSFLSLLPLSVDVTKGESNRDAAYKRVLPWQSQDPGVYDQAYLSVVIDTTFDSVGTLFLTPIAFKSFMNFSPFVYFGNAGALREMRKLGFQTFSPLIDESYDDETDPVRRMAAAFAELERLLAMSRDELHQVYLELWPALSHNYWHFHDPDPQPFLDSMQTMILDPLSGVRLSA